MISRVTSVLAISEPSVLPRNSDSSLEMRVGFTKPEGARLPTLRRFLALAFWAMRISLTAWRSRARSSERRVAAKATTCCNLEEMEANWAAMMDSVEGAITSAEASTTAAASLEEGTGAATGVAGAAALDSALGSLGAFTTLTGAEAVVAAGTGEAEAEAVVAEAEVFVVLAIVLFVYTLYRDVFLSLFTN